MIIPYTLMFLAGMAATSEMPLHSNGDVCAMERSMVNGASLEQGTPQLTTSDGSVKVVSERPGQVVITASRTGISKAVIIDRNGRVVQQWTGPKSDRVVINYSCPPGFYIVQMETGSGLVSAKVTLL